MAASSEERKQKRMVLNRESARRSRLKKQTDINDLLREKAFLERCIPEIVREQDQLARSCLDLELDNEALRAEKARLADYFDFLCSLAAADGGRAAAACGWDVDVEVEPLLSSAVMF